MALRPHTEPGLGDCSYLNTCHRMDTCRYVHWILEVPPVKVKKVEQGKQEDARAEVEAMVGELQKVSLEGNEEAKVQWAIPTSAAGLTTDESLLALQVLPPQWINFDLRSLDVSVLGKFEVVVADPPWAIHQEVSRHGLCPAAHRRWRFRHCC